jgi:SAM-dependent methyltransferase
MLETADRSPKRILQVAYAFWQSKALLSAVELDVFTTLGDGPLHLETLRRRVGIHERGARDFFDALVALGFLCRDEQGRYANHFDADRYLDRAKATFLGGVLEHLNKRHYRNWGQLTEALRTGTPQSGALGTGSYIALYEDNATQATFLKGMTAGSRMAARALALSFPWRNYQSIIDIGTAQGCVPVEIARANPHLVGGGFDLPAVEREFANYVHDHGLSDRLRFYPGDFFTDPMPKADVLVMGRILHNWDLPTRRLLLEKAYQALPPGGSLIIYDPMIDDERLQAHALLSSLNMLIETVGGAEYTTAECKLWMAEAGFCEITTESLLDVHTAIIGFKGR